MVLRIFSKAGLSKDLYSKVYKTCGIKKSEDDTRSAVLCRSGVTFVDKMDQFISGSSICKGLGELARCFLYHVRSHANLVHPQILSVCRSFDRPMPGPFPASPPKPGKSALRTRLSELRHFMQSPSG